MVTTNGLIIGVTELEDKGRYLRILCSDGIHEIYARGAKKSTSKNNPGTEIFCYSKICFSIGKGGTGGKGGKDGFTLDSSEPLKQFYNLRTDIKKLALANFFADIVSRFGVGNSNNTDKESTLNLFLLCLHHLDTGNREIGIIKSVFELRYACEIGFMPALIGCGECHKYDDLSFVISSGKLYCDEHIKDNSGLKLSETVLHAIRFVCLSDLKKICDFKLSDTAAKDFYNIAEKYLLYHTEKHLQSLDYFNRLK
jgi:DNA repair protein RecO (recombination protein O)